MTKKIKSLIVKKIRNRTRKSIIISLLQFSLATCLTLTLFRIANEAVSISEVVAKVISIILMAVPLAELILDLVCSMIVRKIGVSVYSNSYLFFKSTSLKVIPGGNSTIYIYSLQKDNLTFRLAQTEEHCSVASFINHLLYSDSVWEASFEEKMKRNYSHFKKNRKVLQLIYENDIPVGFTHIIPVNEEIWQKYINGEISDNAFLDAYVASGDNYDGIIIFSVACVSSRKRKHNFELAYKAIFYHIQEFLQCKPQLKVLVQNSDKRFIETLNVLGFHKEKTESKDKYPIYTATLINRMNKIVELTNDSDLKKGKGNERA